MSASGKVLWHGTTEVVHVPGEVKEGDLAARKRLEALASKHGISDWQDVAGIFERWVKMGQAKGMGISSNDAVVARSLSDRACGSFSKGSEKIGFPVFRMPSGNIELGVHFGSKAQAEVFGTAFPFHVDIQNPLRLPDLGTWESLKVVEEARRRGVPVSEVEIRDIRNAVDPNGAVRALLMKKGYDGVVYANEAEGAGDSFIAFSVDQIKPIAKEGIYEKAPAHFAPDPDAGAESEGVRV